MTTTAEVTEYTVDRDEMLTIRRSGHGDAWAVRLRSSRLHRDALAWRAANPGATIVAPTTCGAWDYEPMPTNRDDEWVASHTFALAEALAVCEAEAGATAERERDALRAEVALWRGDETVALFSAAAAGKLPRCDCWHGCPHLATREATEGDTAWLCDECHAAHEGVANERHARGGWRDLPHAAAIRAAMGAK